MSGGKVRLGGVLPNDCKMYAPIFSNGSKLDVSLSISASDDHMRNVALTVVYWDGGEKKIIRDYLAGPSTTAIDFTIDNPTSVPPFILYMESTGIGVVDIKVDYDSDMSVSMIGEYDYKLLMDNNLPAKLSAADLIINDNKIEQKKTLINILKANKETAEVTPSPLIVDLDGDGVETTEVQSGTHFDHDGNGFAENTGWVGKDDGILVRDINGNGEIDNGTELFGNNSVLSNGEKAANGFEALKDLDSNNDGIFNHSELLPLLSNNPLSCIGRNNALWA